MTWKSIKLGFEREISANAESHEIKQTHKARTTTEVESKRLEMQTSHKETFGATLLN